MRPDLLDADAAVEWAEAQIPLLQDGFLKWHQGYPHRIALLDTSPSVP